MGAERLSFEKVRVLHVITRLDRGGSAENVLLTLAGADRARFEVALASGPTRGPRSPTEARARQVAVEFFDVPSLVRAIRPFGDLRALWQLWRLMRRGHYDIVHTHTSKAGLLGRLAARLAGVPRVVHTPHGHVFYGYYGPLLSRTFVWAERWAAAWCQRIITLTEKGMQDHIELGVAARENFVVIHSGVDFSSACVASGGRAALRRELGIDLDGLVVGTLGRLTAIKGQADLLRAFALLSEQRVDLWLLLVGDGEERQALVELACELGITKQVCFAGWRQDIYTALAAMDIFALPSINEGMGKALVEAMYAGLPCVATRVGGVPELLREGCEGFIVEASAPRELAAALLKLACDGQLRQRCGEAGQKRASAYGVGEMVHKIEALYGELMCNEGKRDEKRF